MRRGSNKSIRVSNRRNTEMEEEKLHEAAGQPATEVLAEGQPEPEVSVAGEASGDGSAERADATDQSPAAAGESVEDAGSGEADEDLLEDELVPDDRDPVSDADEIPESDQEPNEDAPLPDGRGSVSEGGSVSGDDPDAETSINAFELLGSTEDQATEAETDAATLKAVLEAIVYVLPEPVPAAQMAAALNQPVERVESILRELMEDTARADRGVFVREVAGGYQVATKPEHHEAIRNFVKNLKQPLKLSGAALETLAVIAYKQPVTAPEIMDIRGVQGVGVLKTLLDRKLITTAGRKNVVGKPILYKTTKEFLTQFGLNRISELPTLKEFEEIRRQSISDDEIEERPEADASAPLLQQAAELESAGADTASEAADAPSGFLLETDPHPEPESEADPQPEAPPTPETGPESEENHG